MANFCDKFMGSTLNDLNLHIESTTEADTRNGDAACSYGSNGRHAGAPSSGTGDVDTSDEGNIITLPFHLFLI